MQRPTSAPPPHTCTRKGLNLSGKAGCEYSNVAGSHQEGQQRQTEGHDPAAHS